MLPFICVFLNFFLQCCVVFYNFLSTGVLSLWLNSFVGAYFTFVVAIANDISPLVSLSDISLLVSKNAIVFWILTLYPAILPNSLIRPSRFLLETIGFFFLYTLSFHLQTMTVLLPPLQFGCILFLLLVWSLWLGLPVLCWIELDKANTLVLLLIFRGKLLVLAFWVWSWH